MKQYIFGNKISEPVVLCLGFFDSMHVGHVALVNEAKRLSANGGASVGLFTFNNSHFETLKRDVRLIYTFDERVNVYRNVGVETLLTAYFDNNFMSLTGEEFLSKLFDTVNLVGVVCGFDYTCGSDFLDCNGVLEYFVRHSIPISVVNSVNFDNVKVSSTLIRNLLMQNKVEQANSLLSEPYFISGTVIHGRRVGSTIGFPTANIETFDERLYPNGVFAGRINVGGESYRAVVNVGAKPTFADEKLSVEVFVDGFSGDLYGKNIKVSLTKFIRSVKQFASIEELKKQLSKDLEVVRND